MSNGKRRKGSGESPLLTAARVGAGRWPWQPVETFATGSKDTCGCLSHGDTFGLSQIFNSQPQGPSTGEEGGLESASPHTQPVIFPVEEKIWKQKEDWKTIRQNTRNQRRFCGGAGALRKVQEMEVRIGIVKGQLRPQSALLAEPAEFGCSFSFPFKKSFWL